jgi:tRNA(Ile)-lysidine synthase
VPATAPTAAEPIPATAFAAAMAAFGPFEPRPHLALAVSGGADSLALALLAADWAAARGGRGTALTVDHGLRAAAPAEAAWVRATAQRLGLAHRTMRWVRPAGARVTQASARAARYRLLEDAAAELGCLHLLTGHHRDDNARTIAMRARRGAGPGLAGMPAVRELDRVRLLRPLLAFERARLRATAARLGRGWIEDPSNRDPRFERTRVATAPVAAGAAATARLALEAAARAWLARHVQRDAGGGLVLDAAAWDRADPELAAELLARAVATVGGAAPAPGRGRVRTVVRRLAGGDGRLTLGGAIVGRVGGRLVVTPERPRSVAAGPRSRPHAALGGPAFGASHVVTDAGILIC